MDPLSSDADFNLLSLPDLIQARDHYHVHLMHKQNVVATAVGRYRIRRTDPWPTAADHDPASHNRGKPAGPKGKRTLDNSEVRPYSWPCVLVLVDQWVEDGRFGAHPSGPQLSDVVPPLLYMPDGKVVPVCVVEATQDETDPGPVANPNFPSNLLGGGYPVLADVQGEEHLASVGCLVTDGHVVYALTNRHVAGAPGEPIYSILATRRVEVGRTSGRQLTRLPFQQVYADWPGKNVYLNLDIGLVEVSDKTQWTAQVYGVGTIGKLADLSLENISLKLIGCPVRAYGCGSRDMRGEIQGLFYRYKSVGGFEYVADFLIGPRKDTPLATHPGDSGAVWLLDPPEPMGEPAPAPPRKGQAAEKPLPMPIAVQWGGHVFVGAAGTSRLRYALATCLSTVCNLLEVDVIRDWNIGHTPYWGAVGHYSIANKACDLIRNGRLKKLFAANLDNISFDVGGITKKNLQGLSKKDFVPLADVPDLVWKLGHYNRGDAEHPNHFADMDKPAPDGRTLLDICRDHPENVRVGVWQNYYTSVKDESRGLLPFRVWQFYQAMVEFVRQGAAEKFVCAAGVLSHYVGDACQPLHISYLFNGDPDDAVPTQQRNRRTHQLETVNAPRAAGVHAAYEDGMVDYHAAELLAGIDAQADGPALPLVRGGHAAAVAVVTLMQSTFDAIKPRDIVNAYLKAKGKPPKQIAGDLYEQFGKATAQVMALGCRCLAMLWDSAWEEGGGDATIKELGAIEPPALAKLYQDRRFLPSHTLDTIGPLLGDGAAGPAAGAGGRAAHPRRPRKSHAGAGADGGA
jgi:hypothetical protein